MRCDELYGMRLDHLGTAALHQANADRLVSDPPLIRPQLTRALAFVHSCLGTALCALVAESSQEWLSLVQILGRLVGSRVRVLSIPRMFLTQGNMMIWGCLQLAHSRYQLLSSLG